MAILFQPLLATSAAVRSRTHRPARDQDERGSRPQSSDLRVHVDTIRAAINERGPQLPELKQFWIQAADVDIVFERPHRCPHIGKTASVIDSSFQEGPRFQGSDAAIRAASRTIWRE